MSEWLNRKRYELHEGDCLAVLRTMPDNFVDAIVTDPPYGIAFMGNRWDYDVPAVEVWAECLRVLKPGGHMLAFAGTRTQHRMAVRIEDAGFEIRDMIAWIYGSGFPKSLNLDGDWDGWGTALKPAMEPITMARKPFAGTVLANLQAHGAGALNIEACRIPTTDNLNGGAYAPGGRQSVSQSLRQGGGMNAVGASAGVYEQPEGRWPANVIHDGSDQVLEAFPEAPGQMADASLNAEARKTQHGYGAMRRGRANQPSADSDNAGAVGFKMKPGARRFDSGSAARFFYCAKASREDRHEGLPDPGPQFRQGSTLRDAERLQAAGDRKGNHHPTVKPTDLMRYLVRLVTPPDGVLLDPYMGSGSTGKAAMLEGFRFVGIERDEDGDGNPLGYLAIARARIDFAARIGHQPALLSEHA